MVADIIICVIIFIAIAFAIRSIVKKKGGCCDSGGCDGCCHCSSGKNQADIK